MKFVKHYVIFCFAKNIVMNVTGAGANTAARQDNEWNTDVLFKSQALLTDCANEINDVQIDNTKDPGVVMSMFNIIRIVKVT